jgi:hypothetical protein
MLTCQTGCQLLPHLHSCPTTDQSLFRWPLWLIGWSLIPGQECWRHSGFHSGWLPAVTWSAVAPCEAAQRSNSVHKRMFTEQRTRLCGKWCKDTNMKFQSMTNSIDAAKEFGIHFYTSCQVYGKIQIRSRAVANFCRPRTQDCSPPVPLVH